MISYFRMLTRPQLHAYLAALGGWALDAFDFFIFVFCLKAISGEFHTDIKAVAEGIFLTLAFRSRSGRCCSAGWRRSTAGGPS